MHIILACTTVEVKKYLCINAIGVLDKPVTETGPYDSNKIDILNTTNILSNSSERRSEFRQHRGVFSLLAAHPETRPTPKKTKGKEDAEWVKVQMNTFMKWANSILQKAGRPPMTDLKEDMKDGVVLISLLEILTGKEIGVK